MNRAAITIAGERLSDLEAAFGCMEFEVEPCGYISIAGTLPENLSNCLDRALVIIEAETMAHGHDPCREPEWNPICQLVQRIDEADRDLR